MIWVGILVGSAMRSVEAVNGLMFATMFPITFLADTFAPTEAMPGVLRTVAEWNPLSSLVQAVRELWGNDVPVGPRRGAAAPAPRAEHPDLGRRHHRGDGSPGPAGLRQEDRGLTCGA